MISDPPAAGHPATPVISWPCHPPTPREAPDHTRCHGVVHSQHGGTVRCECPVCDHPAPTPGQLRPPKPRRRTR